ncbi:terpene synthase family protein [Streptomyces afghaniensis]|uniref:terpene synthase family protein n=1 Tax=Streptomyces afghaniensis TaxID=66865 RepID=UPI00278090C3|nr:terpene synthase family protein [Streptomyces afghaniensis]MDQ1014434.1 hypothetical protein [Streptomyces afghaniensis]
MWRSAALVTAGMPFFGREAAVALTCYTYGAVRWDDHLDGLVHDPDAAITLTGEANRVMTEPEAAPPVDDKLVTSLRDVQRMMQECLDPDGMQAMRVEHTQWLGGQLWKLALHRRATPPTVGEWLRMRWQKAGTGVLAALVPPGGGYALGSGIRPTSPRRRIRTSPGCGPGSTDRAQLPDRPCDEFRRARGSVLVSVGRRRTTLPGTGHHGGHHDDHTRRPDHRAARPPARRRPGHLAGRP